MTRGRLLLLSILGVKGQGHMLYIVVKPCKHDTNWTISARTVNLGTHTTYDKMTTPVDFQGHGSKVKVTCKALLLNHVNKINPLYCQLYRYFPLKFTRRRILQHWRCSCWPCDLEVWPTCENFNLGCYFNDGCRPVSIVVFWQLLLQCIPLSREWMTRDIVLSLYPTDKSSCPSVHIFSGL